MNAGRNAGGKGLPPVDSAPAREAAARFLASGLAAGALPEGSGRLLEPAPIRTPDGEGLAGWFAGVAVGDRLAGFLQLGPDLTFRRYSSFQRRPPSLEGCPPVADWLDPARILDRAGSQAKPGESLGEPFLTYDRSPDRLAWAVPVDGPKPGAIFVAGEYSYRAAKPSAGEESTGG